MVDEYLNSGKKVLFLYPTYQQSKNAFTECVVKLHNQYHCDRSDQRITIENGYILFTHNKYEGDVIILVNGAQLPNGIYATEVRQWNGIPD